MTPAPHEIASGPTIVIAGASGYIGRAMIPALLEKFPDASITALSRSAQVSEDTRVSWRACDLFSLKSLEEALPTKCDLVFYLVHSMGPTAQLDQGTFADYDLILADNFARALSHLQVRQLVYLGGLVPSSQQLSLHLQSRLEVERTFYHYQIPTTVFRAGLILGENGSSFQILLKLVSRLPVMICPSWTQTLTTPVGLAAVVTALTKVSLDFSNVGRVYDLAGCRPITYINMMRTTAKKFGKRRLFLNVPFFTPTLSGLWVSLITQTSKALVYPLVASLAHEMVARPDHVFTRDDANREYADLLDEASLRIHSVTKPSKFRIQRKTVRSVQRLTLPEGRDAKWVKEKYFEWLPKFLSPLICIRSVAHLIQIRLFSRGPVLLCFEHSERRSSTDRQLLYIRSGLLVSRKNKGRLEFRVVMNRQFVIVAIHDYRPSLPWFIYKFSQALMHAVVMNSFGRYLSQSEQTRRFDAVSSST